MLRCRDRPVSYREHGLRIFGVGGKLGCIEDDARYDLGVNSGCHQSPVARNRSREEQRFTIATCMAEAQQGRICRQDLIFPAPAVYTFQYHARRLLQKQGTTCPSWLCRECSSLKMNHIIRYVTLAPRDIVHLPCS